MKKRNTGLPFLEELLEQTELEEKFEGVAWNSDHTDSRNCGHKDSPGISEEETIKGISIFSNQLKTCIGKIALVLPSKEISELNQLKFRNHKNSQQNNHQQLTRKKHKHSIQKQMDN